MREGENGFVLTAVTRVAMIKTGLEKQADVEARVAMIKTGLEKPADVEAKRVAKTSRGALLLPIIPAQLSSALSKTDTLYQPASFLSGLQNVKFVTRNKYVM